MKKLLYALLLVTATSVFSETDHDALRAINDIRKGRPNSNAIEDLYVSDDGTIRGDLTVMGNETIAGNVSVKGTLTTTGAVTQNGNLDVNGNGEFNSITVRTNGTVGGNLSVTGNVIVVGSVTGQNVTCNGQFNANGNTTLGDNSADRVAVNGNIAFIPSVQVVTNGQVITLTGPYVELSNTDIPSCTNRLAAVQPGLLNFVINIYNRGTNDIVITEAAPFTCAGTSLTIGPKDCFDLNVRNTNDLVQSMPIMNN